MDPLSLIGKTLAGHFLVEGLAGEGRFSLVYKGQHVGPHEPVALKCLKLGLELDPASAENFLRRFREENRTHSRLSRGDPHFVRTIGSGMTTGANGAHVPYTVLEWLVGHSLAEDFRKRREGGSAGRPLAEVIELFDGAVSAICFAHDSGVPHGDLNAGNFFFATDEGASVTLKVLDFGIANVLSEVTNEIAPNASKPRIFNPAYGAPEHFDSSIGTFGPWTDVYALALIVLEALRDRAPIEKDFKATALNRQKRPSPMALGIRTGAALEAVIARALAVSPQDRFQHAEAFWTALKAADAEDAASPTSGADDEEGDTLLKSPPAKDATQTPAPAVAVHAPPVAAPAVAAPPVVAQVIKPLGTPIGAPAHKPGASTQRLAPPAGAALPPLAAVAPAPTPAAAAPPFKPAPLPASAFSAHGMSPSPLASTSGSSSTASSGPAITPPMLQLGKPAHLGAPGALGQLPAPVDRSKQQSKRTMMGVAPPAQGAQTVSPGGAFSALVPDDAKKPVSAPNVPAAPVAAAPPPPPPPPPGAASGAAALTLLGVTGESVPTPPPPHPPKSAPGQRAGSRPKVAPESENKVMVEATAPPKATVSNHDLPSVIVDEPALHAERLLRNKQTLIIRSSASPVSPMTPMPAWVPEPPPAAFAGPVVPATAMPIAESAYERRPSRARRRLMTVAIISFIFVFVAVGGLVGMNWYLARTHRALPALPFLNP